MLRGAAAKTSGPGSGPAAKMVSWGRSLPGSFDRFDLILVGGLLTLPLQVLQISVLQPGHVWMLLSLAYLISARQVRVVGLEVAAFAFFISLALIATLLQDYERIKTADQILKFVVVYPGFYLVGRSVGATMTQVPRLPVGYVFLGLFLVFQFAAEALKLPLIYKDIDFGEGALHGTFKERNWLAFYFFLVSYVFVLHGKGEKRFIPFFLLNVVVTILTRNKTALVACGLVYLVRSKISILIKLAVLVLGGALYVIFLGDEFSDEKLQVKLQDERGLAFTISWDLIGRNLLGYGFGFVESYFSSSSVDVVGLGEGTNSVFAVPLDVMLICGVAGLLPWLVFFGGFGLGFGAMAAMVPIFMLSFLNPLHQSELVYFAAGVYVSYGLYSTDRVRRTATGLRRRLVRGAGHFSRARATGGDPA